MNLNDNQLTELNFPFARSADLRHFYAANNHLQSVNGLSKAEQLIELNLHGNQLRRFPRNLGRLRKLKGLILSENRLESLPESLCKLEQLESLTISFNPLTRALKNLRKLKNIKIFIAVGVPFPEAEKKRIREALPPDCNVRF